MTKLISVVFCASIAIIITVCAAQENVMTSENTNMNLEDTVIVPSLELRSTAHNKYLLEVYSPEGMTNFSKDWHANTRVTNPTCMLEGGNLLKLRNSQVNLVFVEYTDLSASVGANLKYSITKAVFKIVVEGQGYIQCRAAVNGSFKEAVSDRKLYRYVDHSFSIKVTYNCSLIQCNNISMISNKLSRSLNENIDTTYLHIDNIHAVPVKQLTNSGDSMSIIYRIEISMLDQFVLNYTVAKQPKDPKFKDWELLLFLTNIISLFVKQDQDHAQTFTNIRSTKYCHSPSVNVLTNTSKIRELLYPTTELGQTMVPKELCVTKDGGLYVLECLGDFIEGAHRSSLKRSLVECAPPTTRTNLLYQLSVGNHTKSRPFENILQHLETLLTTEKPVGSDRQVSRAESKYVADVLSNIIPDTISTDADLKRIATITNALIGSPMDNTKKGIESVDTVNLIGAQENSNSSNKILDSLDHILNGLKLTKHSELIVADKFITLILDLSSETSLDGIRGLAIMKRKNDEYQHFKLQDIVPLTRYDSFESLLAMDIALAVMLPQQLFHYDDGTTHRLVINVFHGGSLFEAGKSLGRVKYVLSVTLDGKRHQNLEPPLILMFGAEHENKTLRNDLYDSGYSPCVFWDFKANSLKGDWSHTGCTLAKPLEPNHTSNVDVCICTHLTHFAELLHETPSNIFHEQFNTKALDIITIVGCSLSLFGLLGIAVTAIVFPKWREGANKKVQLNLCAALTLLMVSFLTTSLLNPTDTINSFWDSWPCMISGIVLHYSIIASFCWMIVAAWGQYQRLTKPFESLNRKPHYVLKATIFAWGLPVVPCVINLGINLEVYSPPFCYPSGYYLYFSVLLPVILAVSLNMTIFSLIIFSIYNWCGMGMGLVHLRNNQNERKIALRKLSTIIFLFLLLGLSWIFGICNFPYVFCFTATMQGFAVFIFFVVLDRNTRTKWYELFGKNSKDKMGLHSYSSSADYVRRSSQVNSKRTTRISTVSDF